MTAIAHEAQTSPQHQFRHPRACGGPAFGGTDARKLDSRFRGKDDDVRGIRRRPQIATAASSIVNSLIRKVDAMPAS